MRVHTESIIDLDQPNKSTGLIMTKKHAKNKYETNEPICYLCIKTCAYCLQTADWPQVSYTYMQRSAGYSGI